jgi:hypothetical protein
MRSDCATKKKTIWRQDDDDDNNEEEEDNFVMLPKRNKTATWRKRKHKKRKATINSDLVFGAYGEAEVDEEEDNLTPKKYMMTDKANWRRR